MTLILTKGDTGEGVIDDIRNLIGPPDVEQAKEESPERHDCIHYHNNKHLPVIKQVYCCNALPTKL